MRRTILSIVTTSIVIMGGWVIAGSCSKTKARNSNCPLGEYQACHTNIEPNPTSCGDVISIYAGPFSCEDNGDNLTKCVAASGGPPSGPHNRCAKRTTVCDAVAVLGSSNVKCTPVGVEFDTYYSPTMVTVNCGS